MKTAIQELIEWMEESSKVIPFTQEDCYDKAKYLLKKEKEQMFACFRNGFVEGMSQHAGLPRKYKEFEDYYNTIFNNNGTERI